MSSSMLLLAADAQWAFKLTLNWLVAHPLSYLQIRASGYIDYLYFDKLSLGSSQSSALGIRKVSQSDL